ncbi:MAG TPA: phosphatase PAP2 family protein [Firmicutes bacterium]|nr:phosphatase PAP2 family protein [Bacillota bacterium]
MTTAWAEFLQKFSSPFMDTLVYLITSVGSEIFYTLALPLIYWVWSKEIGYRVGIVLLSSDFLNRYLKVLFHIPRPPVTPSVRVIHPETGGGYAFPSGHAQGSTAFWGWLSLEARESWLYMIAAFAVVIVSASRIYLNVHWPQDVLGGIGIGLLVLAVWVVIFRFYRKDRLSSSLRIPGCILLPVVAYAVHPHETHMLSGLLMGLSLGRLLEDRFIGWKEKATLQENVLKVFTGILGFLVLRFGLKTIFPDQGFFHVLRYALAGLWVTLVAPWIFVKMGWEDYAGDAG